MATMSVMAAGPASDTSLVEIYCGIAEMATMCLLWVPQQTQVRGLFGHS